MKPGEITDPLQQELDRALQSLVAGNVTGIATELIHADDGTLTVGFSLKLNLSGKRVAGTGALSYSRKFKDEVEFITPDPDQPRLPGIEPEDSPVTPKAVREFAQRMAEATGADSVTLPAGDERFVLAGKSTRHSRKGGSL